MIKVANMQCKSFFSFHLNVIKLSMIFLGALLLCQTIPNTHAADPIKISNALKSEQPQNHSEVVTLLKGDNDEEKFLFFKEAFVF